MPNKTYKLQKTTATKAISAATRANLDPEVVPEVKITLTMKVWNEKFPISNIPVPQTPSELDIVNAWWKTVDRRHETNPIILSLSREPLECEAHDGKGARCRIWRRISKYS
jgi:hypothetical protein